MIEVAVGDEDRRAARAERGEGALDRGGVAARVDDDGLGRGRRDAGRDRCSSRSARARAGRRQEASGSECRGLRRPDSAAIPESARAYLVGPVRAVCSRGICSQIDAPEGIRIARRSPLRRRSSDHAPAPAGQVLGDHQVRERAWLTVLDGEADVACGDSRDDGRCRHARHVRARRAPFRLERGRRDGCSSLLAPWPADGALRATRARSTQRPADAAATPCARRFCCWRHTTRSMK